MIKNNNKNQNNQRNIKKIKKSFMINKKSFK